MGVIIYSFNLNISPKIPWAWVWYFYVRELHSDDTIIKDFVIKSVICAGPWILSTFINSQKL